MKVLPIILCLFFMVFSSCNEINPIGEKEIPAFIKDWNDMHTPLKASYLERNYMDVVQYYDAERTKLQVQKDKLAMFEQFPDYKQEIRNNDLKITKEGGSYLVAFDREIVYNDKIEVYETYLLLALENSKFKILREGVTEYNKYQNDPIFPKSRAKQLAFGENRQLFGDFNGDELSDYAYVESPVLLTTLEINKNDTSGSICNGACTSVIYFSGEDLSPITIENVYKSQLENLKDLNGDGADEIGLWDFKPDAKRLFVFDATNSKLLVPPLYINTKIHRNLNLIDVIKKTGPNKITVTRSEKQNEKWELVSEVLILN